MELPDLNPAKEEALLTARELLAETIKTGQDLATEEIIISDEFGQELYYVPLTAALPETLKQLLRQEE